MREPKLPQKFFILHVLCKPSSILLALSLRLGDDLFWLLLRKASEDAARKEAERRPRGGP